MARILRRRVAQMPKVASSRRNLASEINQYLKLGMTAQQIIEKMIPDDPSVTPEMMDPIFDMMARRQGATAPLAERVARARQLAGIQEKQSPSEVVTPPSQVVAASPAPSPRAAVPPKSEFFPTLGVDPEQQKFSDDFRAARRSSMPTEEKIRFAATPGTSPEARREMVQQIALDIFGGAGRPTPGPGFDGAITANSPEDAMAQAEALVERAEMAQLEEQGSAEMQSGLQAMARAKSQAKAEVSQSIQEAQIAENAEQLKSSFRQMYNAIKEGSGMYDFADNVQRAVPLFLRAAQASKASGDDVRLLQTIIRKSVREAELADKQAERTFKQEQFDAKVEETKRKEDVAADVAELEWGNKNDFQDKKTADALRVAQEKGRQIRRNKMTRGTPATSQEQMLGKSTALDANKKIAAEEAKKIENEKELETALKDPRIAKLIKPNGRGGFTALKKLDDHERKRLLPIYRLVGKIQGNDDIIKFQTAREKAAREQMANRADIDAIDRELGLDD